MEKVFALIVAFIAIPAIAGTPGKSYLAADLGAATYSNVAPFPNPGILRLAIGTHFIHNVSLEAGYSTFGGSKTDLPGGSTTLSASAFQVAIIGGVPLNPQFEFTGKLGFSHNMVNATATSTPPPGTTHDDLLYGIGALYRFNPQFDLRMQYESFGNFESGSNPMSATALSLGVLFNY